MLFLYFQGLKMNNSLKCILVGFFFYRKSSNALFMLTFNMKMPCDLDFEIILSYLNEKNLLKLSQSLSSYYGSHLRQHERHLPTLQYVIGIIPTGCSSCVM